MLKTSTLTGTEGMDLAPAAPKCPAYRSGVNLPGRRPKGAAVPSQVENLNREYRMTSWPRKMSALVLAAVLAAGVVSCTSDDSMGPSAPETPLRWPQRTASSR